MRRTAQSSRHVQRPSLTLGADDLGMLRQGDESNEDVLRRLVIEKDRENDKLQTQVQLLQAQLAKRPPAEKIQELQKEYKNLELLLQGTQRENERCMTDLQRGKAREKMLERELAKLAGENWQSSLDIAPSSVSSHSGAKHQKSNTISSVTSIRASSPKDPEANLAHIEQVRLLILGMEQRLQTREEKLQQTVQKAESEAQRFEEIRKEIL